MNATATAARGGDELLSTEEAAIRLHLSATTLAKWRLQGRGPGWQRVGAKRVLYPAHEIAAFLAKTA